MNCCGSGGAEGEADLDKMGDDEKLDDYVQGLSPEQLEHLAAKVYALLRRELRLDADRGPVPVY